MILSPAKAGLTTPGCCVPRAYARGYFLSPLSRLLVDQQAKCLRSQLSTTLCADQTKGFP